MVDKALQSHGGGQKVPDYLKSANKFLPMAVRVEKVENVHGSTAGAGSGDFHQYRQMRRKERYRMVKMEAEARRNKEKQDYAEEREHRHRETEVKTMKKSLKRAQKKARKKMAIKMDKLSKAAGQNKQLGEDKDDGELDQDQQDGHALDTLGQSDGKKKLLGRFAKRRLQNKEAHDADEENKESSDQR